MKTIVLLSAGFIFLSNKSNAQSVVNGEKLFARSCTACHTIGEGKRVGPDLKGATTRRKEEWLIKFIRSSQTMVKAGDPVAVKVFNENNNIPMPDQQLSPTEIKDLLAFIKKKGG